MTDEAIWLTDGAIWLTDGAIWLTDGAIWLTYGAIWLTDGAIWLTDGAIWLTDGACFNYIGGTFSIHLSCIVSLHLIGLQIKLVSIRFLKQQRMKKEMQAVNPNQLLLLSFSRW